MADDFPSTNSNISTLLDRSRARATLDQLGIPKYRSENWKYTNPKPLIDSLSDSSSAPHIAPSSLGGAVEILPFVSAEAKGLISEFVGALANGMDTSMPSLNLLNLSAGYVIRTTACGNGESVVRIEANPEHCERVLIVVESGSTLRVIESTEGGNRVIECIVHDGGTLVHTRLQESTDSLDYSALAVQLGSSALYQLDQYSSGTRLRRNDISIDVVGEGSTIEVKGGWKLTGKSHLDTQISVNHYVPRSQSKMKFHGVAGDDSRSVFNGRIFIARDAQHTSAHLNNKNILTGENAEIYTKPELEIYADDVVCSHGATSGQLDEEQVFYLRTRGLTNQKARELLLNGFLQEVIEGDLGTQILGLEPMNLV
ncbi:MAG: SufD family Fe-S cluster assembly protein [Gammaproteobacteria bacterium]|nr:SufD family Fe-S cluster assembly protein [Gammaproteobacteria bacterium]